MHDFFDILGVPPNAGPPEIRRACGRRARPSHPDIWDGDVAAMNASLPRSGPRSNQAFDELSDTAIDFVDMASIVDRIREGFFAAGRRSP